MLDSWRVFSFWIPWKEVGYNGGRWMKDKDELKVIRMTSVGWVA